MKGKLIAILSIMIIFAGIVAKAIPAAPQPKAFTQPTGETVTVVLRGDERHHCFFTTDGYPLLLEDNTFFYAKVDNQGSLTSSGILAADPSNRQADAKTFLSSIDLDHAYAALTEAAQKATRNFKHRPMPHQAQGAMRAPGLFADASFPVIGKQKVLVVLVEYTDVAFRIDNPYDYFYRMLNEDGFSDYGGTGSAAQYFRENSNAQFEPEFDVYGPITLANKREYYGANDWGGNDVRPEEMAIEACQLLDDEIDFTEYDRNGDGYIDNIYIYYAGEGEASSNISNSVWPHSWNVSYGTDTPYYFDGVRLDRYGCSNEWEYGRPDGVGTFIHEFSHVMGLPDLYATSYSSAFTPSTWSALDYGPYNNDGCTPPNYGTFERYALGWMEPQELTGSASVTLNPIISNEGCIVNTHNPNEYFLFENRQQTGWDKYIPGHGMLIWHIEYNANVWQSNSVNNQSNHQYVDIIEADNTQTEASRDGDAFPGTGHVTSFTATTRPAFVTWDNTPIDLPITDISEAEDVIRFNVCGGVLEVDDVELYDATDITESSFSISWSFDPRAPEYVVSVYTRFESGDELVNSYLPKWNKRSVGPTDHATITGLTPDTQYYCVVAPSNGVHVGNPSREISVITGSASYGYYSVQMDEPQQVTSTSFVASWDALNGTQQYFIDVYCKGDWTGNYDSCDFTGGVAKMPEGWTSNSRLTYGSTAYAGEAIPSLRLSSADAFLTTPTYDSDIESISFWHRGYKTTSESQIRILALIDDVYQEIDTYPIVTDAGGATYTIDNLPRGTRAIKIEAQLVDKSSSLAIDDVVVLYGVVYDIIALPQYTSLDMGSALTCTVEGLTPETTYYYTVLGYDGTEYSRQSQEMTVTTLAQAGIQGVSIQKPLTIHNSILTVNAPKGEIVTLTDVMGRMLACTTVDASAAAHITLPARGIYLVKVGADTYKVKY